MVQIATDSGRPIDIRAQAAAAVTGRLENVEPALFGFLLAGLDAANPPLVRLDAADALGKSQLDDSQLQALCRAVAAAGVLEVPKLLPAFEQPRQTRTSARHW